MVSYYNSKHPGLILYLLLVSVTSLAFLFGNVGSYHIGLLAMAWGIFTFMRALSLFEINDQDTPLRGLKDSSKKTNRKIADLPYDLMSRMSGKDHLKRGKMALETLSLRSLILFILAIIYCTYTIYEMYGIYSAQHIIQITSVFFMVGTAFWIGQTYAHSHYASRKILIVFGSIFALTFTLAILKNATTLDFIGFETIFINGWEAIKSNTGYALLCIIFIYGVASLIPSLIDGARYSFNAAIGLIIIALLTFCAMFIPPSLQGIALWISGASLFSIFWIRSHKTKQRSYGLFQCE